MTSANPIIVAIIFVVKMGSIVVKLIAIAGILLEIGGSVRISIAWKT